MVLTRTLYGEEAAKRSDLLPEQDKERIRTLSSAVAAVVGGVAGSRDGGGNAVDVLANAQVGGVVGRNAVQNNYLSQKEIESFIEELTQCNGDQSCRKATYERYRLLSKQNRDEMRKSCIRGSGADSAECAGHLDAARGGMYFALFGDSPKTFNEVAKHDGDSQFNTYEEARYDSNNASHDSLASDSKELPAIEITAKSHNSGYRINHFVIYENMFDIAHLEPNRENARVINRYLDKNTFNHTNQPKSLLRPQDLWHYMWDTAPKLDQTLPKQVAMDQLHMQPPGVLETAGRIINAPGEVAVRSVDGFVVGTAESIPDLVRMGSKLNPVDMSTFAFRMATNEKARLETQDQVFGLLITRLIWANPGCVVLVAHCKTAI